MDMKRRRASGRSRLALRALLGVALTSIPFAARSAARPTRVNTENLMHIVTPSSDATARAHPFVNVIVRFGTLDDGTPADPTTFRAHIHGTNVTRDFQPIVEAGQTTGMRAALAEPQLRIGGKNHIRFTIRSVATSIDTKSHPRTFRDDDRLRFRATKAADDPPSCKIAGAPGILSPGIAARFDGTQSQDPDFDEITYHWDFGDGTTSTDPQPTHAYAAGDSDRTVMLSVSDGQQSTSCSVRLLAPPSCDAGTTPGSLSLTADDALEFGSVAPGSNAAKTFVVTNTDAAPRSQLKVRLGVDTAAFSVEPTDLTLGPSEAAPVTITFAPSVTQHESAIVTVVACTKGQPGVALVAHGYGGNAPGTGPTLAGDTAFYQGFLTAASISSIVGILPSGQRFAADNSANLCLQADGTGTGDLCYQNSDCQAAGETCVSAGSNGATFDPSGLCGDGLGNLYVVSEETVTDPSDADEQVTGSLVRFHFDGAGNRTDATVLRRLTENTTQVACDGIAPDAGGLLFVPEYHVVNAPDNCARSAREALEGVHKSDGSLVTFPGFDRIDAYESPPLDPCNDDYDPVADLEATRDGSTVSFLPENGGIYQLRPKSLPVVQSTPLFSTSRFQIHPDGSVLYALATDVGSSGVISLYRVFPEQVQQGAVRLEDLVPCASFDVPNNRTPEATGNSTSISSFASDRTAQSGSDATVLVSFRTDNSAVASATLRIQGTLAFSAPAGSNTCTPLGLINLEPLDMLSF